MKFDLITNKVILFRHIKVTQHFKQVCLYDLIPKMLFELVIFNPKVLKTNSLFSCKYIYMHALLRWTELQFFNSFSVKRWILKILVNLEMICHLCKRIIAPKDFLKCWSQYFTYLSIGFMNWCKTPSITVTCISWGHAISSSLYCC